MQNIATISALISAIASLLAAIVSAVRLYLEYRNGQPTALKVAA
ncbi:hypothetical protein C8P63_11193 [Melghirimyces profundicolus]|uniref:Uncharacterized protein n=1 Tax=Melghirimyces profundicolus TaxID=1242148 RepID=A0A2T6BU85_9BACL|nr:hypothetical protein [Melghirimyces profundicolus]PTX59658.1 hypothetical protein C8P63_11193 [Melghirimyces profundicolus]